MKTVYYKKQNGGAMETKTDEDLKRKIETVRYAKKLNLAPVARLGPQAQNVFSLLLAKWAKEKEASISLPLTPVKSILGLSDQTDSYVDAQVKKLSRAIVKAAKERMVKMPDGESVTLEGVIRAARKDELSAIELLQQVGEKVGEGIASLLHLFNPDMVVLGGEIVKAGDLITVPVRQAMNKYALARIRGHCELRLSDLGGDAAILGTQLMAMGHLHQKTGMTFALYE